MPTVPSDVSTALIQADYPQAAQALARALAQPGSGVAAKTAHEFVLWSLLGPAAHGQHQVSTATRHPGVEFQADLAQARAALAALMPVIAPTLTGSDVEHKRLWSGVARWSNAASKRGEPASSIAAVCADAFVAAIAHLDRRASNQALEWLTSTVVSPVRHALFEQLTQPAALAALAQAKVSFKPADLVIVETHHIALGERSAAVREDAGPVLEQQQRDRWSRVIGHPAGPERLLRLDLNPIASFQALLQGAYTTPSRAAWVGWQLLPLLRAKGKGEVADRLASLLDEPALEERLQRVDQEGTVAFFHQRPHYVPVHGWEKVLETGLMSAVAKAWRALAHPDLTAPQREAELAACGAFVEALLEPVLPKVDPHRAALAVRTAAGRWRQLPDTQPLVAALAASAPTLDGPARAHIVQRVTWMFDNPLVAALQAAQARTSPDVPPTPSAGQLLVTLLAGAPAPRPRAPRA